MTAKETIVTTEATQNTPVGVLRIFCCGGGGINIGSKFPANLPARMGIATIKTTFIDTSRTNLSDDTNPEDCYVLEGVDGSGKVRKENHEQIAKEIPRILVKHQPGDFNIVAFTAAGGTGSVAGPLLVAELLERGFPVVAVVIGSEESAITATNTFNTLKSLDHISRSKDKPVVMHYTLNDRSVKRSEVDREAVLVISALTFLASRQNKELDSMDVNNFLNYNKVPYVDIPAQLTLLKVFNKAERVEEEASEAFSLACLLKSEDDLQPDMSPAYSCAGYFRSGTEATQNLFFALETSQLNGILSHLQKNSKSMDENKAARQNGPSFIGANDAVSSTGLIM
jgi:hypothetical protein